MIAFKLLRLRKDGTAGPLFINRRLRVPFGEWLEAGCFPTKGFAVHPGWHCTAEPNAPHLSPKGRAWFKVEIEEAEPIDRPASQGGRWYLAKRMKVLEKLETTNE
jgi:hypothetical protein